MEYLTFALPLALLLTWLGWQIWDRGRSRRRRETELRRLGEMNESELLDWVMKRERELDESTPGWRTQDGPNISGDKPGLSHFARAGGIPMQLETADDRLDSSSSPDQPTGGADGSRITAWPNHRGMTVPLTPESPISSSSEADGSRGVADTQQGGS